MVEDRALSFRHRLSRLCATANRGKHAALSFPIALIEKPHENEDNATTTVCDPRRRASKRSASPTTLSCRPPLTPHPHRRRWNG